MDFNITGTMIWYYYICPRQVWLMSHGLEPDQDDENIRIGRLIGKIAYEREKKEVDITTGKFDILRTEKGRLVVGEIKKSSRFVESASKQLLFYLLQLKEMGIEAKGELLIPEERKKIEINLGEKEEREIREAMANIEKIALENFPPLPQKNKYCKNCAYAEFCWA
ncbi:CRISPR-associated protein Cas4 [Thermosyntropha sp.]|uniref:CRISPR-associated protein Cas4 n=1 Tax=Thermosyntropha sp. TaxID=2740820 RepID=UPI0025FA0372|nr:CRISPR-associated protein Cas4 [Thermosyntropha sp.]MBO8159470.1 CRISPR-associated protein Cas4 [Thermosyntropha sp.]